MGELLIYLVVIMLASIIVWKGGSMLESSAETLSIHYKLSPVVQGSIVTAVGSSFPELSTTVISTLLHGEFDLGVSAILGSAIFNILMIPGLSSLISGKLNTNWTFVVKDVQFYITSVIALLLIFALAVIYHPVEGSDIKGMITRQLAMVPVLLYLLYLFLQQQETLEYRRKAKDNEHPKSGNIKRVWLRFGVSLILIVVSVEALVRGTIFLGEYFNTPNFIWGATVLAAATSVPDAIVSVKEAMNQKGLTSLANVIGSNIFDLLIAVPAGILIAGTSMVNFSVAVPLMLFLSLVTVVLILMLLYQRSLSRLEGGVLVFLYAVFVAWIILESNGLIGLL
jgi:cation:H+ antiporter